ncbi:MAG: molybdopterin cofactor-binding domain-containing protein, partial [bacterium]
MNEVGKSHPKLDGLGLVTGKPAYTDDLAPGEALVVKALRSPHAFARIKKIDTSAAKLLPGVEAVFTHKDVPRVAITRAGQGYPEPSPHDWFVLDEYVRFVGDEMAIVAAVSAERALAGLDAIKVEYEVFEPVLDFEQALDHPSVIHPEPESHEMFPTGFAPARNLVASYEMQVGDVAKVLGRTDVVLERTYYTQAQDHVALEPHTAVTYLDVQGRLNVISSTQNPFHTRRLMGEALQMPLHRIRVHKPCIGGGFGGKQMVHGELFAALVTLQTGKPARFTYSRSEVFQATTTRHGMRVTVKAGANRDGTLTALDMNILSNTGAYGEHALTVLMVAGAKTLPMYNRVEAVRFAGDVVYTNLPCAGACRSYGVIQANFALESLLDELAAELELDPVALRKQNKIREGETSPLFAIMGEGTEGVAQTIGSCKLDHCIERAQEMIGWSKKYPRQEVAPGRVRGVGMAIAMQGSGIPAIDMGSAMLKLNDQGFFSLLVGATDLGTGSDTILAQMASEVLQVPLEQITVYSADTDRTPFDPGAYASSTTYVTGQAVINAAENMKALLVTEAAARFGVKTASIVYDGETLSTKSGKQSVTLSDLSTELLYSRDQKQLVASGSNLCEQSPPPYICGCAEVEVDTETGQVTLVDFVGVADCGTLINPNLAKVQIEGGLVQGIGMALYEDVRYSDSGKLQTGNLMTYKIPTRRDVPSVRVEMAESYEPTGPFGAKSAG